MNTVILDLKTNKVVGYNREPSPLQYSILVPDVSLIKKNIIKSRKSIHKTNFLGQKLYIVKRNENDVEVTENECQEQPREAIMMFEDVFETIYLIKNPEKFLLEDVIAFKKEQYLHDTKMQYGEVFEVDFDSLLTRELVNVDSGFKYIRLNPNAVCNFNVFEFNKTFDSIIVIIESDNNCSIYVNDELIDENRVSKISEFAELKLSFKNEEERVVNISSISIFVG